MPSVIENRKLWKGLGTNIFKNDAESLQRFFNDYEKAEEFDEKVRNENKNTAVIIDDDTDANSEAFNKEEKRIITAYVKPRLCISPSVI
jgi:hypothetical protein